MSVHSEGGGIRRHTSLMQVDVEVAGSEARVEVTGDVDAHTSPELERAIQDACSDGATTLVLDVANMSFIDSSGLRVLVQARQRVTDAGGSLELRQPSETVVRLLELTGLADLLQAG